MPNISFNYGMSEDAILEYLRLGWTLGSPQPDFRSPTKWSRALKSPEGERDILNRQKSIIYVDSKTAKRALERYNTEPVQIIAPVPIPVEIVPSPAQIQEQQEAVMLSQQQTLGAPVSSFRPTPGSGALLIIIGALALGLFE